MHIYTYITYLKKKIALSPSISIFLWLPLLEACNTPHDHNMLSNSKKIDNNKDHLGSLLPANLKKKHKHRLPFLLSQSAQLAVYAIKDPTHKAFLDTILEQGDNVPKLTKMVSEYNPVTKKRVLAQTVDGWGPVLLALARGNTKIAKYLIQEGANYTDETGKLADGELDMDRKTFFGLNKNEVNRRVISSYTPLIMAVISQNLEMLTFLLSQDDINPNQRTVYSGSAVEIAVMTGKIECVKELFSSPKTSLYNQDKQNQTTCTQRRSLLNWAIRSRNLEMVQFVLETLRAKLSPQDFNEILNCKVVTITPKECLDYFEQNAPLDYDLKYLVSFVPLLVAVQMQDVHILSYLLKQPEIDPNIIGDMSETALYVACAQLQNATDATTRMVAVNMFDMLYMDPRISFDTVSGMNVTYALLTMFLYNSSQKNQESNLYLRQIDKMLDKGCLCSNYRFLDLFQSFLIKYYETNKQDEKQIIARILTRIIKDQEKNSSKEDLFDIDRWLLCSIHDYVQRYKESKAAKSPLMNQTDHIIHNMIHNRNFVTKPSDWLHLCIENPCSNRERDLPITVNQDLNKIQPFKRSLLSYFSEYGCKELVAKLLSYGIPADADPYHGITPLLYAVQNNHFDIANALIQTTGKAANINAVGQDHRSALSFALEKLNEPFDQKDAESVSCQVFISRLLIKEACLEGLSPGAYAKLLRYVLFRKNATHTLFPCIVLHKRLIHDLVHKNDTYVQDILALLIEHQNKGSDVGSSNQNVSSLFVSNLFKQDAHTKDLLSYAIELGYINVVASLLTLVKPTSVAQITKNNPNYLSLACKFGHEKIIALLLQYGYINGSDDEKKTPLFHAMQLGNVAIVKQLLQSGVSPQEELPVQERFPLLYALKFWKNKSDLIDLFITPTVFKLTDKSGNGVLWYAVEYNDIHIVASIVQKLDQEHIDLPEAYNLIGLDQIRNDETTYGILSKYVLGMLDRDISNRNVESEQFVYIQSRQNGYTAGKPKVAQKGLGKRLPLHANRSEEESLFTTYSQLIWTNHVKTRMEERKISKQDIRNLLASHEHILLDPVHSPTIRIKCLLKNQRGHIPSEKSYLYVVIHPSKNAKDGMHIITAWKDNK